MGEERIGVGSLHDLSGTLKRQCDIAGSHTVCAVMTAAFLEFSVGS